MKESTFDVLVIGAGTAGQVVAYNCRSQGLTVGIVDNRPFGGTCALRGCDPKKVLVGATEAIDWIERMKGNGIEAKDVRINWKRLMEVKQTFVKDTPHHVEQSLENAGITTYHGTARFTAKDAIQVDTQTIRAKHFVIATGAAPIKLGVPGEEHVIISDDFLELRDLPKRIIFIGGGFISFEFAHITRRAGSDVTILHRSERVLSGFDPDLVDLLVKASQDLGINIIVNTPVVGIEKRGEEFIVHTKMKDSSEKTFVTDLIVHGGGRVPNLETLNLKMANVALEKKGVAVNEYLQSISNPAVYAAGDAASLGLPLTPVAGKEGLIVATNIIKQNTTKVDFKAQPSVVFTVPPLAAVGMRQEEAKEQGLDFEVKFEEISGWYASRRIHEKYSGYKTLIEKNTARILGAHLLGHNADEIINLFALAIKHNITADDLKNLIYAYPTHASNIEYML
ncbi:NAD(P)/FAD-dependent oxidoreductase [Candidatus Roizmanbacteria bacterium]|nr:NAD(P)/FAD-dependent oxidoreductase [Candidatus Roizmanbacteria bacterium]